jgi:hypothetical protein
MEDLVGAVASHRTQVRPLFQDPGPAAGSCPSQIAGALPVGRGNPAYGVADADPALISGQHGVDLRKRARRTISTLDKE